MGHRSPLQADEWLVRDGIPVTSPLWERERVAVELDSRGIHGTLKMFESDRQRDRILLAEGWRTMRVTWRQLQEEPEAIAADLRLALERGAA